MNEKLMDLYVIAGYISSQSEQLGITITRLLEEELTPEERFDEAVEITERFTNILEALATLTKEDLEELLHATQYEVAEGEDDEGELEYIQHFDPTC